MHTEEKQELKSEKNVIVLQECSLSNNTYVWLNYTTLWLGLVGYEQH